jgi:DNA-binding IscR family transcriptional regulator
MERLVAAFVAAGLVKVTGKEKLILARDIDKISVGDILDVGRNQSSGHLTPDANTTIPSVDRVIDAIEDAVRSRCGKLTLRELAQEAPRVEVTSTPDLTPQRSSSPQ